MSDHLPGVTKQIEKTEKTTDEVWQLRGIRLLDISKDGVIEYDIGLIAEHALDALQIAVIAIEQCVTGEKLIHSLHVGDFFESLNRLMEVQNGQGVLSEHGEVSSLQEEIERIRELATKARALSGGRGKRRAKQ